MASKGGGGKGPQRWKKAPQQQQRADGGSKHAAQGASTRPAGPQTREGVVFSYTFDCFFTSMSSG